MRLEDLKATRGASVATFLAQLKAWARGFRLLSGPGIYFTVVPGQGTWVRADLTEASFSWAFQCSLGTSNAVTVNKGTVNSIIPYIGEKRIDGVDANGNQGIVPRLTAAGP